MGVGAGLYMCDVVKKVHVRYLISWWVLVSKRERDSRSLFAVARPSVCLFVCLSLCNARGPYSGGWNFRQYFYRIWYLGHPRHAQKILRRSSQGNPSVGGVKHKRGSQI